MFTKQYIVISHLYSNMFEVIQKTSAGKGREGGLEGST